MRLRQIALVTRELEPPTDALCEVLGIEVGFNDPGVGSFGLVNAVMPVGNTFLEVVTPEREGTAGGRHLERRQGDGGYMVILQTEDVAGDRARIGELGVRVVWEADTGQAKAIHLHPRDVGGAILSFDQMHEWDAWQWAGPEWRDHVRIDVTSGIVGAELQSPDPDRLAKRWSDVLGIECRDREIALDEGTLRFVADRDGRGEGLGGIDVACPDPAAVLERARERGLPVRNGSTEIAGLRIRTV